jgi:hypothetical protein
MADEKLLWQEDDGTLVYFDYDATEDDSFDNDKMTIRRVLDVEPLLEENKRRRNEGWVNKGSEFVQIAAFPSGAAWLYGQMRGMGERWPDILKRENFELLGDMVHERDLSGFRTVEGDFRANFKRRR